MCFSILELFYHCMTGYLVLFTDGVPCLVTLPIPASDLSYCPSYPCWVGFCCFHSFILLFLSFCFLLSLVPLPCYFSETIQCSLEQLEFSTFCQWGRGFLSSDSEWSHHIVSNTSSRTSSLLSHFVTSCCTKILGWQSFFFALVCFTFIYLFL